MSLWPKTILVTLLFILVLSTACEKRKSGYSSSPTTADGNVSVAPEKTDPASVATEKKVTPIPPPKTTDPASHGFYPRRLLAIGIGNYTHANPIQLGRPQAGKETERRDFVGAFTHLAKTWNVPGDQTFILTDAGQGKGKNVHPPVKSVVVGAIERFLETSRKQDRLIIAFAGHAIEKNGEAYLVPLDGEFGNLSTLIPLSAIYADIEKSPAQEKLIILDVCRMQTGRAPFRPAFGKMMPALDRAIHACPARTTVWTSCSVGQFSYECETAKIDLPGLRQFELHGSTFIGAFIAADLRAKKEKSVDRPSDPLPVAASSASIDELTNEGAIAIGKKAVQTPKITSRLDKKNVAYNPNEKPARHFEFPTVGPAPKKEIVAPAPKHDSVTEGILKEIALPSIRSLTRDDGKSSKLPREAVFFPTDLLEFGEVKPTFEEIRLAPKKYADQYPIRVAAVEALSEMRRPLPAKPKDILPESFDSPINDNMKRAIVNYQRAVSLREGIFDEQKTKLDAAAKKRSMEKSKRWLANFDYAYAQVQVRLAFTNEYNAALSKARLDQMPELDAKMKQKMWRLMPSEKMLSAKDIRDLAEEGMNALGELEKNYPHTPWATFATGQRKETLGLKWEPSPASPGPKGS